MVGLICGLRMIELEGAILCPEPDPRVVTVKYAPKGDRKLARCTTWAYAVDILGPLSWWDEYRTQFGDGQPLCPAFTGGKNGSNRTDILKAKALHASAHRSPCVPAKAWCAITKAPGFLDAERWKNLNLTPHCLHGSTNDICHQLGKPCGLDPAAEGDSHGNWILPPRPDKNEGDTSAPSGKRMRRRYATGENRRGSREEQLLARWKLWYAIGTGAAAVGYDNIECDAGWTQIRAAVASLGTTFEPADPMGPPRYTP